ncbi:MAG: tryptophan-rich sensory protein [Eubacteriales bacterium]|nr:tryptophan-rich sensory protein [Eubacteriales bacterium]
MRKFKVYLVNILIALGVGSLSAFLTRNQMDIYSKLVQPPLSPPGWLFPIVWGILFLLMGISASMIWLSDSFEKEKALTVYGIQLAVNFLWSLIFFNMQAYYLAFFWLLLLLVLIIIMIYKFSQINKTAAYLQIPYLLWVIFAGYLTLAIAILN